MRTITLIFTIMLSSLLATTAYAGNVDSKIEQQIRKQLAQMPITAIHTAPIPGLYELQVGKQIIYSDRSGRYIMPNAHIIDMVTRKDLTDRRLQDLNRINWSELPLDKAIVSGDLHSNLKLAIFTDPECPYCKGLEKMLVNLKGVKVYTFLYPLDQLHPHARAKAEAVWCSKDQHTMLNKVMLEGFIPEKASCKTPLKEIEKLAHKFNIYGTPALIAGDGRMMSGAPQRLDMLKKWLENK